jgi:hypothetical protein
MRQLSSLVEYVDYFSQKSISLRSRIFRSAALPARQTDVDCLTPSGALSLILQQECEGGSAKVAAENQECSREFPLSMHWVKGGGIKSGFLGGNDG